MVVRPSTAISHQPISLNPQPIPPIPFYSAFDFTAFRSVHRLMGSPTRTNSTFHPNIHWQIDQLPHWLISTLNQPAPLRFGQATNNHQQPTTINQQQPSMIIPIDHPTQLTKDRTFTFSRSSSTRCAHEYAIGQSGEGKTL